MVTSVSGPNAAIRSTAVRPLVDEASRQQDNRGKEEVQQQHQVAVETLSVNISAQAARRSRQVVAERPAGATAQKAPQPGGEAAPEAKGGSASKAANAAVGGTVVLDISYAVADVDQNGVVSFAEQHAYELKHPEKRAPQNGEAALSRSSSEAVKAYETVSGAGTDA